MPRRDAGFTLLEVLVAFTIFSAVLVAIYGSLSTSLRGEAAARAVLASTQTARSVMAEIGHRIPLVESTPSGQDGDGIVWSLRISSDGPALRNEDSDVVLQLFDIDLTVEAEGEGRIAFRRKMLGRVDG